MGSGQWFPRAAGVAVPLFSLRGPRDVGTGEIGDLYGTIDWMAWWHHRVLQLLPINEADPDNTSPYDALSAFAIDPSYVSADDVPEVQESPVAREWLQGSAAEAVHRVERETPRRCRRAAYDHKLRMLGHGYERFETYAADHPRRQAYDHFCRHFSWWLDEYALYRALKEEQRWRSWEEWPAPLRDRQAPALALARERLAARIGFFRYVQWVAADQWWAVRRHAYERRVLLKGDLPFVCARDSADVWAHRDLFDLSGSAGAPPDDFSATGQAWGLPLYEWTAHRASGFQWWRGRARHARDLYDIFRVDHVVGLYRTYSIAVRKGGTAGFVPREETVQRAQGKGLMRALLEEAGPATTVVAEDLGTVPPWVRGSLAQLHVPGYRVFRWERHDHAYLDPRDYPALSIATTGTHDTDTLVEWWGTLPDADRIAIEQAVGVASRDRRPAVPRPFDAAHLALLQRLYESGSALTILPLQDLFGWRDRVNVPATVAPENWTWRLPVPTQQLDDLPGIRERLEALRGMIDRNGRWS